MNDVNFSVYFKTEFLDLSTLHSRAGARQIMKYLNHYLTGSWYCSSIYVTPNLQLGCPGAQELEVVQGFEKLMPEASPGSWNQYSPDCERLLLSVPSCTGARQWPCTQGVYQLYRQAGQCHVCQNIFYNYLQACLPAHV